jgi:LPXTG-motif cell wall-anchored protein
VHRPARILLRTLATGAGATILAVLAQIPASPATPTPSPSAPHSAAPRAAAPGGISVHVSATDATPVSGAAFTLTDLAGTTSASGTTGADGILAFPELPAGIYHLRQTATASAALKPGPDQDIVVPDGITVPVTVTDAFTPADLTVRLTDRAHKPAPGAVIAITDSTGNAFTVTTGPSGSAHASAPVTARTGTAYTVTERSGPHGAPAHTKPVTIRAEPAGLIAITLTDTIAPPITGPATPTAAGPVAVPTSDGRPITAGPSSAAGPGPTATTMPAASATHTQLAHTGAENTTWLAGAAGLLMTIGAGALSGSRYRRSHPKAAEKRG